MPPYCEANIGHIHNRIVEMQGKECTIISDQQFRDILLKCENRKVKFDPKLIEEARIQSGRAVIVYDAIKDSQKEDQSMPGYQQIRDELNAINLVSEKLTELLQSASDKTMEVLCLSDEIVKNEIAGNFNDISISSFGHPIYRPILSAGGHGVSYWSIHNIINMIDVFSKITRESKKWNRPRTMGGRPSDEATKMLVLNLRPAWELLSDAPFSFGQHKNLPATPATAFCWEMLKVSDPEAQFSCLATAMKKAIQRTGAKRGRPLSTMIKKSQKPSRDSQ